VVTTTVSLPDRWLTDWDRYERLPLYTRANAGEVLPDPASPLGWTLVFERGLLPGWLQGLVDFGIYRQGELPTEHPPVAGLFGGYFYINLSHCRLMAIRLGADVAEFDASLLGSSAIAPPYQPRPDDACAECSAKSGETIGAILGRTSFPEIQADLDRVLERRRTRPALSALTDAELVERARSFLPELDNAFNKHDYSTLGSTVGPAMLGGMCAQVGEPDALLDLISGLGEVRSASPSWGLWTLSRLVAGDPALTALFDQGVDVVSKALASGEASTSAFRTELAEFLREYGQRGPNEWDIRATSWEAGPDQVLALVDSMRHSSDDNAPDVRHARLEGIREQTTERIRANLPDDATRESFDLALRSAMLTIPLREVTKLLAVTTVNEVRMAIRELGSRGVAAGRFSAPEDVMMLLESELDDYVADPEPFTPVIAERLVQYLQLFDLEPPFIVDADPLPLSQWPRRGAGEVPAAPVGEVLSGIGGSAGRYEGIARVVSDLDAAMALEPGEILVAPLTDAAWTPLFLVAGAAVVDVGAMNSHAVVVSRELGIPCVLSLNDASVRLRSGMRLAVDGTAGTVTVISA
jgi:pyruvate,water dikinase